MFSNFGTKNLKIGTDKNPVIIDAIAPFSSKSFQKIDSIITGQNVAAIPDQPKITNQNIVRSGDIIDTLIATNKAKSANPKVIFLESIIKVFWSISGFTIFW